MRTMDKYIKWAKEIVEDECKKQISPDKIGEYSITVRDPWTSLYQSIIGIYIDHLVPGDDDKFITYSNGVDTRELHMLPDIDARSLVRERTKIALKYPVKVGLYECVQTIIRSEHLDK
jgi:hypothetical protein